MASGCVGKIAVSLGMGRRKIIVWLAFNLGSLEGRRLDRKVSTEKARVDNVGALIDRKVGKGVVAPPPSFSSVSSSRFGTLMLLLVEDTPER